MKFVEVLKLRIYAALFHAEIGVVYRTEVYTCYIVYAFVNVSRQ